MTKGPDSHHSERKPVWHGSEIVGCVGSPTRTSLGSKFPENREFAGNSSLLNSSRGAPAPVSSAKTAAWGRIPCSAGTGNLSRPSGNLMVKNREAETGKRRARERRRRPRMGAWVQVRHHPPPPPPPPPPPENPPPLEKPEDELFGAGRDAVKLSANEPAMPSRREPILSGLKSPP